MKIFKKRTLTDRYYNDLFKVARNKPRLYPYLADPNNEGLVKFFIEGALSAQNAIFHDVQVETEKKTGIELSETVLLNKTIAGQLAFVIHEDLLGDVDVMETLLKDKISKYNLYNYQ